MGTTYDDPRRWWALAALALAVLTLGFDITIMNVALPTIATELEVGTDSLQWMVTATGRRAHALDNMGSNDSPDSKKSSS